MELQKKFTFTRGHFFIAFREKGRETGRERETPIGFSLIYASNGDQICNLGKCPDQESNPQTFGLQDDTPANWATQARAELLHLKYICFKNKFARLKLPDFKTYKAIIINSVVWHKDKAD